MKNFYKKIAGFALLCASISIPVAITDVYLKLSKLPSNNSRLMTLSGGKLFSSMQTDLRRYEANRRYRSVGVYGNKIDFDYYFDTDEYGYREVYDCKRKTNKKLVITGDSFTEAQGADTSWTYTVQKDFCDIGYDSVMLGMNGYSIIDMEHSSAFAKNSLGATKLIVGIIPSDLYRNKTRLFATEECSAMYVSGKKVPCGKSHATWWHVPMEMSDEDIKSFASKRYDVGLIRAIKNLVKPYVGGLYVQYFANDGVSEEDKSKSRLNASLASMKAMISDYSAHNIMLVIIGRKHDYGLKQADEKSMNKLNNDLENFKGEMPGDLIIFDARRKCNMTAKDFHDIDNHPSTKGQISLGNCVRNSSEFRKFLAS